ncbi:sodium:solute symporter family protein [Paenibacillus xerothermodurans]|uniref:Sodium:solute symporter family protein n=1 Tax=Paenibacillus xerothermodurans TaxID=1977292 RepID=A0A2W1NAF4_PAEXE|nr:sodium:solute symporter family protein [Paenibacillus xerothermodurans]PZE21639.1 sodium:solute symporter family protein [Paenibacillus xerothermodurans]
MTVYGAWIIGFALFYTAALIFVGQFAKRRAAQGGEGYFVGGRNFNRWMVCFCITGLFSGSTFIAVLELAYLQGVSAIWYGVAETIQILIIAFVIIGPFRKKLVVTVTGLIGDRYGRSAKALAGAITAFTFPMWSVATAIAFASALHVFTGISLTMSVAFTAILLFIYLQAGGMWSIAFTQTMNFGVFMLMFAIGIYAFFVNPGIEGLQQFAAQRPQMFDFDSVGLQVIVAWFGTFLVNVILAQAAFQMALSCKTPEEGQKGLKLAAWFGIPFTVCAILFGIAAAAVVPDGKLGLIALPQYLMQVLPAPLVGLFFLGVWACALSWGAPCQFSGATSLGRDVGSAVFPKASNDRLVTYTKWSLLLLTVLMIVFGLMRTEQSAWWNIFAWTARNSATFAPVVAALFWPQVTRAAVLASLGTGFASGVTWYYLGGWHVSQFYLNIHPVWIGMSVNVITIIVMTLLFSAQSWKLRRVSEKPAHYAALAVGAVLAGVVAVNFDVLHTKGLVGLLVFSALVALFISVIGILDTVKASGARAAQNKAS